MGLLDFLKVPEVLKIKKLPNPLYIEVDSENGQYRIAADSVDESRYLRFVKQANAMDHIREDNKSLDDGKMPEYWSLGLKFKSEKEAIFLRGILNRIIDDFNGKESLGGGDWYIPNGYEDFQEQKKA